MLEWVGDIGGLFEGLRFIVHAFIAPLTGYAVKTAILSAAFSTSNSSSNNQPSEIEQ